MFHCGVFGIAFDQISNIVFGVFGIAFGDFEIAFGVLGFVKCFQIGVFEMVNG